MISDPLSWHWNDMGDMKKEERMFKCYVPLGVISSCGKSAKKEEMKYDIRY